MSGEDPVAKLAANGENPSEEAGVHQMFKMEQPWEIELVLHYTTADARCTGKVVEFKGIGCRYRSRLFTINVLSRSDCKCDICDAAVRRLRIKVDFHIAATKCSLDIC